MNRRDFILGSAGALALTAISRAEPQAPATTTPEGVKLNGVFDGIMKEDLDRSPIFVTTLGLDKGDRVHQKFELDESSIASWEGDKRRTASQLVRLRSINARALNLLERVNYDSVVYGLALSDQGYREFPFIGSPYVLSQLTGSYQTVPDFLDTQHAIETKEDADAYLSRLSAFANMLDQEVEQARHDLALGVVPPDFVIDKTLIQMRALRDAKPDTSNLVQSLARRAREKGIDGDWEQRAAAIYTGKVQPAIDRQIALMTEMRLSAVHTAGVNRLPKGEAFYALALKQATTSDMPSDEIHKTGLELVKVHSARIDGILKSQGYDPGLGWGAAAGTLRRSQVPLPQHRRGQGQADRRPERARWLSCRPSCRNGSVPCRRPGWIYAACPRLSRSARRAATT